MPQFDVHRRDEEYLLDCQSDDLDGFSSRVVVPLLPVGTIAIESEFARLTPRLGARCAVRGEDRIMATHLGSAVDRGRLGPVVASLTADRYTIQAALDTLTGSY